MKTLRRVAAGAINSGGGGHVTLVHPQRHFLLSLVVIVAMTSSTLVSGFLLTGRHSSSSVSSFSPPDTPNTAPSSPLSTRFARQQQELSNTDYPLQQQLKLETNGQSLLCALLFKRAS